MTAGPEQARLLKEFGEQFLNEETKRNLHHEEGFCTQKNVKEETQSPLTRWAIHFMMYHQNFSSWTHEIFWMSQL